MEEPPNRARIARMLIAVVRATTLATFAVTGPSLPSRLLGICALYVVGACVIGSLRPRLRLTDSLLFTAIICADLVWCTAAFIYYGPINSFPAILYVGLVASLIAAESGSTAIALGLCVAGVYYGTMYFIYLSTHAARVPHQLTLLQTAFIALTGVLSGCLSNQWQRLKKARLMVRRLTWLGQATAEVPVSEGDHAVYQDAAEEALHILEAQRAWVVKPVENESGLRIVAVAGDRLPARGDAIWCEPTGIAASVWTSGKSVVLNASEARRQINWKAEQELCVGAVAAAPIHTEQCCVGVLLVSRSEDFAAFAEDDLAVLQLLCRSVGSSLETAHLIRQLHEASITDSLTGLYNHGVFLAKLAEQVQHAREAGTELSLIVLDMDDFKQINDSAGHWEGNRILRALADTLRKECRDTDIIARCGGDEFAVLLPGVGPEGAAAIAERTAAALYKAAERPGVRVPISASWGIASYPWDASTDEALFRRADDRLYEAKHAGGSHLAFDPIVLGSKEIGSCIKRVGELSEELPTTASLGL
ncbi:MAG: sensor domain-containing diguanylate cyclase [Candidatus Zipacnadales bacterium]